MVKVYRDGYGLRNGNDDKIGKTKGGKNGKITAICDQNLNMIDFRIDEGSKSDMKIGEEISDIVERNSILVVGRGCNGEKIQDNLKERKIRSVISYKSNSKKRKKISSKKFYKKRNVIERFFLKIKQFCRIATRYDKLSTHLYR